MLRTFILWPQHKPRQPLCYGGLRFAPGMAYAFGLLILFCCAPRGTDKIAQNKCTRTFGLCPLNSCGAQEGKSQTIVCAPLGRPLRPAPRSARGSRGGAHGCSVLTWTIMFHWQRETTERQYNKRQLSLNRNPHSLNLPFVVVIKTP